MKHVNASWASLLLAAIACGDSREMGELGEIQEPSMTGGDASQPVAMAGAGAGSASSAASPPAAAGTGGAAFDAGPAADSAAGDDTPWEMLISADWELQPNQERYFCQRLTLTEDVYLTAVKAINPRGTHHTALTVEASATAPDGFTECNSAGLAPQGIFGSGVGTEPVFYPEGVGLRLRAGQQLLLNLHVFNTTDQPLRGTSGTAIRRARPEDVEHVAESLLAGPVGFSVPPGGRSTVEGRCTMSHDVTLFAVQPHMHQTGVHMKAVAESSVAGTATVHDGPFDFENQLVYTIDPLPMKRGDVVRVECTFENDSDKEITFGESSTQEMCFLVLHRYPAADSPSVACFN